MHNRNAESPIRRVCRTEWGRSFFVSKTVPILSCARGSDTFFKVIAKNLRLCEENARFSPEKWGLEGFVSYIYDIMEELSDTFFAQVEIFSNNYPNLCYAKIDI